MENRPTTDQVSRTSAELPFTLVRTGVGGFLVSGELDLAVSPMALDCLADAGTDIALDCSGLTFIDAAGLRMLVALHEQCDGRGAKLTIVNPSRCVRRLIRLAELDDVLHCTNGAARS